MAGDDAKAAQKGWVDSGVVPGLIAFDGDLAVGWMAIEPRGSYDRLAHSRVLKPVDEQPVWSVTCFFTRKNYRHKGVTVALLLAGIDHVKTMGGNIVEGYPIEAKGGRSPDAFVFTGLPGAFRKAGFVEAARYSLTRPIYRFVIDAKR